MLYLSEEDFTQKIGLKFELPQERNIVLDFYGDYCAPCQMMLPIIEKIQKEFLSTLFYKVDIEQAPEIFKALEISSIPTFIFIDTKNEVIRLSGAMSYSDFRKSFITFFHKEDFI